MSRVGRRILHIPENVEVKLEKRLITIKGPLGSLKFEHHKNIEVSIEENKSIVVKRRSEVKKDKMLHGTTNSLISNMIEGVTKGYKKELEINGVGYNVKLTGNILLFSLGYSHKIEMEIPKDFKVEVPKPTSLIISGVDKQAIGLFASKIKKLRKVEPYGGKGIRYKGELVRRKAGKANSK